MHPLSRDIVPIQGFLKSRMEVLDGLEVAETNHETVCVGGEGVNRNAVHHGAIRVSLELPKVRVAFAYFHSFFWAEAVLEYVLLVLLEGECVDSILDLDLRALCFLCDDESVKLSM